jgi:hypothetical protein
MSDNNTESDRRLQEIGKQLGTPILSPITKIETSTDNEPPRQYSESDLTGTSDSLSKSKNPMLQYLVAGAIGLGVVGVPLSVLFGLGSTTPSQTAVKPTTNQVDEEHASLADKELESLKTESALDIQAKAETQTVAQTAVPTKVATVPAQKPQPVAKVATKTKPKPVPKPTVVPPSPAPVTVPVAKVTLISFARAVDTPIVQPIKQTIRAPIQVAAKPIEQNCSSKFIGSIPLTFQVSEKKQLALLPMKVDLPPIAAAPTVPNVPTAPTLPTMVPTKQSSSSGLPSNNASTVGMAPVTTDISKAYRKLFGANTLHSYSLVSNISNLSK